MLRSVLFAFSNVVLPAVRMCLDYAGAVLVGRLRWDFGWLTSVPRVPLFVEFGDEQKSGLPVPSGRGTPVDSDM